MEHKLDLPLCKSVYVANTRNLSVLIFVSNAIHNCRYGVLYGLRQPLFHERRSNYNNYQNH